MEVKLVKISRDFELGGKVQKKGKKFYVSEPHRKSGDTRDYTTVFDYEGVKVCDIQGHWFDFAGKTLFEKVDP